MFFSWVRWYQMHIHIRSNLLTKSMRKIINTSSSTAKSSKIFNLSFFIQSTVLHTHRHYHTKYAISRSFSVRNTSPTLDGLISPILVKVMVGFNLRISRSISLDISLGKDIHHVFFMGNIVENANAFSFEVLNKGYAKDRYHVFYHGTIVPDLQPAGFQALSND